MSTVIWEKEPIVAVQEFEQRDPGMRGESGALFFGEPWRQRACVT